MENMFANEFLVHSNYGMDKTKIQFVTGVTEIIPHSYSGQTLLSCESYMYVNPNTYLSTWWIG
jgi:hypothetical protein